VYSIWRKTHWTIQVVVFWVATPAAWSSKMMISYHITMQCHNSYVYDLNLHCHENHKSHTLKKFCEIIILHLFSCLFILSWPINKLIMIKQLTHHYIWYELNILQYCSKSQSQRDLHLLSNYFLITLTNMNTMATTSWISPTKK
jgi:hypothetical protein